MSAPVADQRALRGVAATLSWQNIDADGSAAAPAGTVTVGVTKADGTEVLPGTATSGAGSSPRTVALTAAHTAELNLLTATWTDGGDLSAHTTLVELVGGYYFSVAEARASDSTLADTAKYPDAAILVARREVEDDFEQICDVAFVPRYRRERLDGTGCGELLLPTPHVRRVVSIREYSSPTTYQSWSAGELAGIQAHPTGRLVSSQRHFAWGDRNLVIEWEHGHDRPPGRVKTAGMRYLRYRLNESLSAIPDRATGFTVTDGGTYRLDTASRWKVGVPDIDAELERWSMRVDGFA